MNDASPHLCTELRRLAVRTWRRLYSSRRYQKPFSEETITEWNLLDLDCLEIPGIRIRSFTKREEFNEGADWELWLRGLSGDWIAYRMQAKVINKRSAEFSDLHYRSPRGDDYQSDVLIDRCRNHSHQPAPVFVLYCNWDVRGREPAPQTCSIHPPVENFGCSIVSAHTVVKLRNHPQLRKPRDLDSLSPYLRPWHVIACDCGFNGGLDLARASQEASSNLPIPDWGETPSEILYPTLHREVPSYVEILVEGEIPEITDPNLSRVVIVEQNPE